MSKPKNPENQYWTEEVDDAIIKFRDAKTQEERDKIFNESLRYPFYKMAECVFNRNSFKYIPEQHETTMHDCVVHLMDAAMHHYDKSKGKSFSYFTYCARNFYIQLNDKSYEAAKKTLGLQYHDEFGDDMTVGPTDELVREKYEDDERQFDAIEFYNATVKYFTDNFDKIFLNRRHVAVGRAFLKVIKTEIPFDSGGKKVFYEAMRKESGLKTQYITRVMCLIRAHYDKAKEAWDKDGNLDNIIPPLPCDYQYWRNWRNWSSQKEKRLREKRLNDMELRKAKGYKATNYQNIYQYGSRYIIVFTHKRQRYKFGSYDTIEETIEKYNDAMSKLKGKDAKLYSI